MRVGAVSRPRNSALNTQLVHYDVAFKIHTNKYSTNTHLKQMKATRRPFHHLYNVEEKTSVAQLSDDFGDFPPIPLQCQIVNGHFSIIRMQGLGIIANDILTYSKLYRDPDIENKLSTEFSKTLDPDTLSTLRIYKNYVAKKSKLTRAILNGSAFCIITALSIKGLIVSFFSKNKRLGYFAKIYSDDSSIHIISPKDEKAVEESVLSHEHIHLLQGKDGELHSRTIKYPEMILRDDMSADHLKSYIYLFEKKEVEARLHECVLSFYREHTNLPITASDFISMLLSSKQLGWLIHGSLDEQKFPYEFKYSLYTERDPKLVRQLEIALLGIKNNEILCRFTTEVLAVMYGNLLRYYGDEKKSTEYLKDIKRPNLYDKLYGIETPTFAENAL